MRKSAREIKHKNPQHDIFEARQCLSFRDTTLAYWLISKKSAKRYNDRHQAFPDIQAALLPIT
jgi:hypothetical protein